MARPSGEKNKKLNLILVCVLVVAVIGGFVATRLMSGTSSGATVVVTDADGNVQRFPLDEDADFTVSTDAGWNHIVISDGTVCVESADCPHQDCVDKGAISAVGEQIICLPHELIVTIVSDEEQAAYDVIGS